jgi:hypothetical protein
MTVYKGRWKNPRRVEVCARGCGGDELDGILQELNADGWSIRQIFQEEQTRYRVFAQRETPEKPT